MAKTKITITLEGRFAELLPEDLRKFAEQGPAFKDKALDIAAEAIERTRKVDTEKTRIIRKIIAVGAGVLRHVGSLTVEELKD